MDEETDGWLAASFSFAAILCLFSIPIALLCSGVAWLRDGRGWIATMADMLVWAGWAYPHTSWVGSQRIIDWYLSLYAVFALPVSLAAILYLGAWSAADSFHETRKEAARPVEAVKAEVRARHRGLAIGSVVFIVGILVVAGISDYFGL